MPNKITKNIIISILLLVSTICFAFGALALPNEDNLSKTILLEEISPASAGRQIISNMNQAIYIPDAIVGSRENNTDSNAKENYEFSRRYNNKQSIISILLMLSICAPALILLRFQLSMVKTIRAGMPVLALSLGGNSPPVIRA